MPEEPPPPPEPIRRSFGKEDNFATLQRQFDELRKLIEQRNAEIADLKAKLAKAPQD